MEAPKKSFIICILILLLFGNNNFAQNITNKKIFISSGYDVRLQFGNEIKSWQFNPTGSRNSFAVSMYLNRIILRSSIRNFEPITLTIDEGTKKHINTHVFVLEYKDSIGINEQVQDFSTKEKIEAAIASVQQENETQSQSPQILAGTSPAIISSTNNQPEKPVSAAEESEQRFSDLKAKANRAYNEKRYDDALDLYQQALKWKSGDEFCKSQIDEIKRRKQEAIETAKRDTETKVKDDSYKSTMDIGKEYLTAHDFDKATVAFQEALTLKPGDADAIKLLKSANNLKDAGIKEQEELRRNEALEKQYKDTIDYADNAFEAGLWKVARQKYNSALKLKKNDKHALDGIAKIDGLERIQQQQFSQRKNDSIANEKYFDIRKKGDDALAAKDYSEALKQYKLAHLLKPSDPYPNAQISQIAIIQNQITAQLQDEKNQKRREDSINSQFKSYIAKSDAARSKKDYDLAYTYIIQALILKPDDADALKKSAQINDALTVIESNKKYEIYMRTGDSLVYQAKDPDAALRWYDLAIALKPEEALPKTQYKLANYQILQRDSIKMIKENKDALNRNFDEAMVYYKQGESARIEKKYGEAYEYYTLFLNKTNAFSKKDYSVLQTNYIKEVVGYTKSLESYKIKDTNVEQVIVQYPNIDFTKPPPEQIYSSQRLDSSKQKAYIIKEILPKTPRISIVNNITDKIRITCQSMNFKEKYIYLRFTIKNNDASAFLTGPMMLSVVKKSVQQNNVLPLFISDFPVVLPMEEKQIVYVIPIMLLWKEETLVFELSDRLNGKKMSLIINDVIFNMERSHQL